MTIVKRSTSALTRRGFLSGLASAVGAAAFVGAGVAREYVAPAIDGTLFGLDRNATPERLKGIRFGSIKPPTMADIRRMEERARRFSRWVREQPILVHPDNFAHMVADGVINRDGSWRRG